MPYIDPSIIEQVKRIDLLSYLQSNDPDELVRLGNDTYCTKTHDSLKISNGRWFWWSRGFGGHTALEYLIKVKGLAFPEAVQKLDSGAVSAVPVHSYKPESNRQGFVLPIHAISSVNVESYLELRGIALGIIKHCIDSGLIFETRRAGRPHAVFVGYDESSTARYAALRGCGFDFKGEAKGSDKRYSFRIVSDTESRLVHVFESAIDALSFATLLTDSVNDWRKENLLSLGGIPPVTETSEQPRVPQALEQYLKDNPKTETVCLHTDNDEPGINAANTIAAALYGRGFHVSISPPPMGKDVSEYLLMHIRGTGQKHTSLPSSNPKPSAKTDERKER